MLFGKKFKVLKELPKVFSLIGVSYPEYFVAFEKEGELCYYIFDDKFGFPSPANDSDAPYAIKLRTRSEEILRELEREGYVKEISEELEPDEIIDCDLCDNNCMYGLELETQEYEKI